MLHYEWQRAVSNIQRRAEQAVVVDRVTKASKKMQNEKTEISSAELKRMGQLNFQNLVHLKVSTFHQEQKTDFREIT